MKSLSPSQRKKRAVQACDPCRVKKTKCNGKAPCDRCAAENKPCIFTERRSTDNRTFSADQMLLIQQRLDVCSQSMLALADLVREGRWADLEKLHGQLNECPTEVTDNAEEETLNVNDVIRLVGRTKTHAVSDPAPPLLRPSSSESQSTGGISPISLVLKSSPPHAHLDPSISSSLASGLGAPDDDDVYCLPRTLVPLPHSNINTNTCSLEDMLDTVVNIDMAADLGYSPMYTQA